MKKVLLGLAMVALTFSMNAQKLTTNGVDEFTGVQKKITKSYKVAKMDFGFMFASAIRIGKRTALRIGTSWDTGCSGASDNYITFLYSDGRTVTLKDVANVDCSENAISMFDVTNVDFADLKKIRLRQSDFPVDGVVSGKYSLYQLVRVVKH